MTLPTKPSPHPQPLVPGYYWYRQIVTQKSTKRIKRADIKSDWTVMRVHGDDALMIDWGDWSESLKHFVRTTPHNVRYEWIGPLQPPTT